jgi:transcriptional regulator with XRE-family HTH domain
MLKVFGSNIKELRKRRRLTQEKLAEMAGISPNYLGEVERGEKNMTALIAWKLSQALDVSIAEILSHKKDEDYYLSLLKVQELFSGRNSREINKAIRVMEVLFE